MTRGVARLLRPGVPIAFPALLIAQFGFPLVAYGQEGDPWSDESFESDGESTGNESADESGGEERNAQDDGSRPSLFNAAAGFKLYSRSFRYTDSPAQQNSTTGLLNYTLDAAPMLFVNGDFFPFANSSSTILQNIGLTGELDYGVATDVAGPQSRYNQTHIRYLLGLRGRVPLGRVAILPLVGYGGHEVSLSSATGTPAPFPDVSYGLVELGSDITVRTDPISIRGYGRVLLPTGFGGVQSETWYPNTSGIGVDWGASVGFTVAPWLDLLTGIDVRIYGLDFNPLPAGIPQNRRAGGATDQFVSLWFGFGFRLPEKGAVTLAAEGEDGGAAEGEDDFDSFD